MANLLIDIGNTALKAAWADGITLGKTFRYQGERMLDFILSLTSKSRPEKIVVSSIRFFSVQNIQRLEKECDELIVLESEKISESYSLPAYLTPDRVASILAARYLFKGKSCTIFDLGTTLAIDVIGKEGEYHGGYISPGCHTRFKSVNRYSRTLPLISMQDDIPEIGTDIATSIISGIISGIMYEIDGYVNKYPENINVFTGGDAIYFAKRRKNSIFVVCNLVLMGLALIALEHDQ